MWERKVEPFLMTDKKTIFEYKGVDKLAVTRVEYKDSYTKTLSLAGSRVYLLTPLIPKASVAWLLATRISQKTTISSCSPRYKNDTL